jgi:site-specific DNA-methyltransferase (adenine-specific)
MNYTIYNMDCLEWMKSQPDQSVDIIVSSPPYNIGIMYNTYGDKMNQDDYLQWQNNVWTEACRILKKDGHLFLNIAPTRKDPLLPYRIADNVPWTIQNSIMWSKCLAIDGYVRGHGVVTSSKKYLPNGHECMFQFTYKGKTNVDIEATSVPYQPAWAEDNFRRTGRKWRPIVNNWFIPYETCGSYGGYRTLEIKGNKKHPAIFPKELVRRCIKLAGYNKNKIVYDPFAGTGTTLCVAKELGMNAIGTEIDTDYCNFIHHRLKQIK